MGIDSKAPGLHRWLLSEPAKITSAVPSTGIEACQLGKGVKELNVMADPKSISIPTHPATVFQC